MFKTFPGFHFGWYLTTFELFQFSMFACLERKLSSPAGNVREIIKSLKKCVFTSYRTPCFTLVLVATVQRTGRTVLVKLKEVTLCCCV